MSSACFRPCAWRVLVCFSALLALGSAFEEIDDRVVTKYLSVSTKNHSIKTPRVGDGDEVCLRPNCGTSGGPSPLAGAANASEYHRFVANFPSPIDFLPVDSRDEKCAADSRSVLYNYQLFQLWALRMVDSMAKVPSGLLEGNVNHLGHFDECVMAKADDDSFSGQYCLAAVKYRLPENLKHMDQLLHSYYYMNSDLDDPGHRIPHFSSSDWALCVPTSCSHTDVERRIRQVLDGATRDFHSGNFSLDVVVRHDMCQSKHQIPPVHLTSPAVLFFLFFLFLCMVATILDYRTSASETETPKLNEKGLAGKLLYAFSVRRNLNVICDMKPGPGEIPCLHGARFLAAIALLLSHKTMALFYIPFVNRNQMVTNMSGAWSVIGRTAIIYTDVFIYISGILTGANLLKQLSKNSKLNLVDIYANRWCRFTPNLLVVILFCTYILPSLGSGPMWNLVVSRHADLCTNNAWRSLMYIHNYFGFENMCLTHTHQLGIDMQLFIAAPLFVYCMWRWPRFGIPFTIVMAVLSTALRFYVSYQNNLTVVIVFGISVSQLFDVANLSYILPTHRLTIYLMGTLTAYYLHHKKDQLKISKATLYFGWTVAIISGLWALLGPYKMSFMDFKYDPMEAAFYTAFAPVIWGFFLVWSVIMVEHNHAGWFGTFLSLPCFKMFTQIAYAIYLTQFPIFFYNIGRVRTSMEHSPWMMFNFGEFSFIFLTSTVLTVMFDLPFQHVRKLLWPSFKSSYNVEQAFQSKTESASAVISNKKDSDVSSKLKELENNNIIFDLCKKSK
ncbi:unnamed protein product [Bemisia tabaci]|uniref:Nose resistant-to-fluoxetine protein N-terminal domain-containing protein n=1 Tax=Bemisia tabaci TaxID=7038 RepID=A0A9P0AFI9_BEMTA|nr:unnamed protein product [Bemisia tabaci]